MTIITVIIPAWVTLLICTDTVPTLQHRTGVTFKESAFNDSTWEAVDAPHDFIMYGAYDQAASLKHGYFPRNVSGWYRKQFTLPDNWKGRRHVAPLRRCLPGL